jgi:hypothetical protein
LPVRIHHRTVATDTRNCRATSSISNKPSAVINATALFNCFRDRLCIGKGDCGAPTRYANALDTANRILEELDRVRARTRGLLFRSTCLLLQGTAPPIVVQLRDLAKGKARAMRNFR